MKRGEKWVGRLLEHKWKKEPVRILEEFPWHLAPEMKNAMLYETRDPSTGDRTFWWEEWYEIDDIDEPEDLGPDYEEKDRPFFELFRWELQPKQLRAEMVEENWQYISEISGIALNTLMKMANSTDPYVVALLYQWIVSEEGAQFMDEDSSVYSLTELVKRWPELEVEVRS